MANGRRLHALREFRQYLDNEIYQINKQLEAEGANGASGAWLSEQRHTKQALYDELDYVIETYGNADTTKQSFTKRDALFVFAFIIVVVASFIMSILALIT